MRLGANYLTEKHKLGLRLHRTFLMLDKHSTSKRTYVPFPFVFAVWCMVFGEHVGMSLPAQHCPTVTNTANHQLNAVM